jgi:hypothetical protein
MTHATEIPGSRIAARRPTNLIETACARCEKSKLQRHGLPGAAETDCVTTFTAWHQAERVGVLVALDRKDDSSMRSSARRGPPRSDVETSK